jgi:sterol desaturase/sphingolipid hydroxylase (fatty acid hydroxylase superfamily)
MSASENFLQFKGAAVVVVFAAAFLLERRYPMAAARGGLKRLGRNFSIIGINVLFSPFIVIPLTALAAQWAIDWRPGSWTGLPSVLLDLLLLDCWIYWWHRLNHRLPFLWRFHEVHHLDETLDATSALRFHFGEVLLSALARAVFIFIAGVPLLTVIAFELLIAFSAIFHHSNISLPPHIEKMIARIIVTPSLHWVHHHAVRVDTDSNYATVLSIWDVVFRSRSKTVRTKGMAIGVEGRREQGILGLVLRPFR